MQPVELNIVKPIHTTYSSQNSFSYFNVALLLLQSNEVKFFSRDNNNVKNLPRFASAILFSSWANSLLIDSLKNNTTIGNLNWAIYLYFNRTQLRIKNNSFIRSPLSPLIWSFLLIFFIDSTELKFYTIHYNSRK